MRGLVRWSVRGLLLVVLVVVGLWGYAEGRQWLLRVRAQRLLADVQRLEVQKSTWADAQKFMTKWGRWGGYYGSCNASHCEYRVMLRDDFPDRLSSVGKDPPRWLNGRIFDLLGLRSSSIMGAFAVQDGRVAGKDFLMDIDLPMNSGNAPYLTVISEEGSRLSPIEADDRALHPYRSLTGWKYFIATTTPKEDRAEKAKLMLFHFDCLTALRPCVDRGRLLPEAVAEFKSQEATVRRSKESGCAIPYWAIARDEQAVLVGDVVWAKHETKYSDGTETDPYWVINLQPRQLLKGKLVVPMDKPFLFPLSDKRALEVKGDVFPSKLIVAGRPSDQGPGFSEPFGMEDCGIVAATPQNLADAKRGVLEDYGLAQE